MAQSKPEKDNPSSDLITHRVVLVRMVPDDTGTQLDLLGTDYAYYADLESAQADFAAVLKQCRTEFKGDGLIHVLVLAESRPSPGSPVPILKVRATGAATGAENLRLAAEFKSHAAQTVLFPSTTVAYEGPPQAARRSKPKPQNLRPAARNS